MRTAKPVLACALVVLGTLAAACGGDKKPARSAAEDKPVTSDASQTDMPPTPGGKEGTDAVGGDKGTGNSGDKAGPAGGMIKVAAMKFTPAKKGKNEKSVEVKADGSVVVDGKTVAKFAGDQLDDTNGGTLVTVGVDGSLVGANVKPGFKFEGDDLSMEGGAKVSVGDDGTITATRDGKTDTIGTMDGGASAKRAALVVVVAMLSPKLTEAPTPEAKPAKGGGAATKTGTKPAKAPKKK